MLGDGAHFARSRLRGQPEARLALKETSMSAKLVITALLFICVTASAQSRPDHESVSHQR